jgi:hypothetical protein
MTRPPGADPVPRTLDWDLWLGPAPERPYKAAWPDDHHARGQIKAAADWIAGYVGVYHPLNFRGWWDFGTGALGDMGCHHFNTPRRALKLGCPAAVSATSTKIMPESWPLASIVTWEFPAREGMPPVTVTWYDGGLKPPRPVELEAGRELPADGILYVGDKGKMMHGGAGGVPRLIPEEKMKACTLPPKTLVRRSGIYGEWAEAAAGGEKPSEDWPACAAPLTELVLLGNVALRVGNKRLEYDAQNLRFTNDESATKLLKPEYRNGWTL